MIKTFLFSWLILISRISDGQLNSKNTSFTLSGKIAGNNIGYVVLWYSNIHNLNVRDTIRLDDGKFNTTGKVNGASLALLWTNHKNINFDDSSVIRFLLGPTLTRVNYSLHSGKKALITGSKAEFEKEIWDDKKFVLLKDKTFKRKVRDSLIKLLSNSSSAELESHIHFIQSEIDTINNKLLALDLGYIKAHVKSYLSMYLLWEHRRGISIDTIEKFYSMNTSSVKESSLGHDVLLYVYPLTDNNDFRRANPLMGDEVDDRLLKISSVYDLILSDTSGKYFEMSLFKGKLIVIDFWASWCKPCIENIPALNEITKHYKSDAIQFVSISLDKEKTDWKRSIIKNKFSGVQLSDMNGFIGIAAIYCKVIFVPKYIVADRNGKIINYSAPQASEPELRKLLDSLLKEDSRISN